MVSLTDKRNGLIQLLSKLEAADIPYVSWKNNHELAMVMAGESDLDLFVPLERSADFISVCGEAGWLEVINPVAGYPWIYHFYGPDEHLLFHHVHVYFKVVTGESWLKEYVLPLDQWLIENRVRSPDFGIFILNNAAQAYLFAIRHLIKGASVSSRLLYARELGSYREEWLRCKQDPAELGKVGPIDISRYMAGASIERGDLRLPRLMTALRFRFAIAPFLRVQWWSLPFRRLASFILRFLNKVFLRKNKILSGGGLVIAVSGVDGAGKSTMLKEAAQVFSSFLTVDRFHLGRPQGALIEFIRRAMGKSNSALIKASSNSVLPVLSARKAFSAMVVALLRFRLAHVAAKHAGQGHLVLVDRWPTDMVGKMDGPRIVANTSFGFLLRLYGRIEKWAYSNMPKADVCYFFELSVSMAIERNRARIKVDKESDEEIVARFEGNQDFHPLARKVVRFDNAGEFADKRKEFLWHVWNEIVSH
jgi:thymidylate kinase